jgi:hypothetical protein
MKALLTTVTLVFAFAFAAALFAAQSEAATQECFNKHAQLMDKPAVKNVRDCWRMHGHLMRRS